MSNYLINPGCEYILLHLRHMGIMASQIIESPAPQLFVQQRVPA